MFNDTVDPAELWYECLKYYANILTPFSPLVLKKIKEVLALKLPVDMICTSHGVIWRENPVQIVEQYLKWADSYKENQITLVYDTMWNGTRVLAEKIAAGIRAGDPAATVKLFNTAKSDKNDIITEIFRSKAILVGSPTINRGVLTGIAALFEEIKGLKFKAKKAAVFGCYGWSGEGNKVLSENLRSAGFEVVGDGFKALWSPDEQAMTEAVDYGRQIARDLQ
jgi:flavorubredoxin